MVRAIFSAEPVNVAGGGCVESVVTRRTHLRFCVRRRFFGVEGIKRSRSGWGREETLSNTRAPLHGYEYREGNLITAAQRVK
jgi:hypothetical protein